LSITGEPPTSKPLGLVVAVHTGVQTAGVPVQFGDAADSSNALSLPSSEPTKAMSFPWPFTFTTITEGGCQIAPPVLSVRLRTIVPTVDLSKCVTLGLKPVCAASKPNCGQGGVQPVHANVNSTMTPNARECRHMFEASPTGPRFRA